MLNSILWLRWGDRRHHRLLDAGVKIVKTSDFARDDCERCEFSRFPVDRSTYSLCRSCLKALLNIKRGFAHFCSNYHRELEHLKRGFGAQYFSHDDGGHFWVWSDALNENDRKKGSGCRLPLPRRSTIAGDGIAKFSSFVSRAFQNTSYLCSEMHFLLLAILDISVHFAIFYSHICRSANIDMQYR